MTGKRHSPLGERRLAAPKQTKGDNVSQCREQARRVYHGAVFEIKKEIPDESADHS